MYSLYLYGSIQPLAMIPGTVGYRPVILSNFASDKEKLSHGNVERKMH